MSGTGDPACIIEGLSGKAYPQVVAEFGVPYTALHVIHDTDRAKTARAKVEVLKTLNACAFYDDLPANVEMARAAGIRSVLIIPGTVIAETIAEAIL